MLLASDLVHLESDSPTTAGYWQTIDALSRSIRQSWVGTSLPIDLPDTPVELASAQVGGRPLVLFGTAAGQVGLLHIEGDRSTLGSSYELKGFNPRTDQIRNIVVSPRRHSSESDVFVTVRRWPAGGTAPTDHFWRAVAWFEVGPGEHRFRPVAERTLNAVEQVWNEVQPSSDGTDPLPPALFAAQVQGSDVDLLRAPSTCPMDAEVLAVSKASLAWVDADGALHWRAGDRHEQITLPDRPVALGFSASGERLVVACGNGRLLTFCGPDDQAPETHELEAGVSVLAVLPGFDLDIIVASQDRSLVRWRFVRRARLQAAWDGAVAERLTALAGRAGWEEWACPESQDPGPDVELRQVLWLCAAWMDNTLLEGFCAVARKRGPYRPGTRAGQELAALAAGDTAPVGRAKALKVYEACGLAMREQVDRARLTQDNDELAIRALTNYWESADPVTWPTEHRSACGNLATRPYLHEATWSRAASHVGVLNTASGARLVVARQGGIGCIELPTADRPIGSEARSKQQPVAVIEGVEAASWTWLRSLHGGSERHAVSIGSRAGMILVLSGRDGGTELVTFDGASGERILKALNRAPPRADRLELALAWSEGQRVWLDPVVVSRKPEGSGWSVTQGQRQAVPVPAVQLDLLSLSGRQLLAASTRSRALHWLELDPAKGWVPQAETQLDSAIIDLRFATGPGDLPVLIFSTEAGRVWCFDAATRRPLWAHHAGGTTTTLDLTGVGEALRIAVCSTPHRLTVLDGQGRRLWRHRIGARPGDISLVPAAAGSGEPSRLVVVDEGGSLSVYWRSDRLAWREKARAFLEEDTDSDRLRTARILVSGEFQKASDIKRVEARRVLLAAAAGDASADIEALLALEPKPDAADLAAMARELHPDRAIRDWSLLWEYGMGRLADGLDLDRRESEMLAELMASLRRRRPGLAFVQDRLADLRGPDWENVLVDHREAALQAAQLWLDAIAPDAQIPLPRILSELHTLPRAAAKLLPLFLPAGPIADWVEALSDDKACDPKEDWVPPASASTASAPAAQPQALEVLEAMRDLGTGPTWERAVGLLRASRAMPPGSGPLVDALRQPALRAPPGEPPVDSDHLDRQTRWLTDALGLRWRLPALDEGQQGWKDWEAVARGLLDRAEGAYRQALLNKLTAVVARSRPRLRARVIGWTGAEALLSLEISHEGPNPLDRPRVEIQPCQGGRGLEGADPWVTELQALAEGDPPLRARLRVSASAAGDPFTLRLRCTLTDGSVDETDWPVDLGGQAGPPPQQSLLLMPAVFQALAQAVEGLREGLALLVLDEPMLPSTVVAALSQLPGTDLVDLDPSIAELGPGRSQAEALDLRAVAGAIEGREARDRSTGGRRRAPGDPTIKRILLRPSDSFVERLGAAERETWFKGLRDRAGTAPAWILVLPSRLAMPWAIALVEAGATILRPALLAPALVEAASGELADLMSLAPATARRALTEAGHDLRLLRADGKVPLERRLAWARAELRGLPPRELCILVALGAARTRLALAQVPPGAVAAETVRSPVKPGRAPKVLVREGSAAFKTARLVSFQRELLVRGLVDGDTSALPEEERRMLVLCAYSPPDLRRLEVLGLVRKQGKLHTLRTDLALVIQALRQRGDDLAACVAALGDPEATWQALDLSALVKVEDEDMNAILGLAAGASSALLRAIGRLWAEAETREATVAPLVQGLTGAPPRTLTRVGAALLATVPAPALPKHQGLAIWVLPPGQGQPSQGQGQGQPTGDPPSGALAVWIGPSVSLQGSSPAVRLGEPQVRDILRAADPRRAFWSSLRAQLDLEQISPFVHNSALPPGSPLFVGRTRIRREIADHLVRRSFLILGARQVGKTSLLHQLRHEARDRSDVSCLYVDCQGVRTAETFGPRLQVALNEVGIELGIGSGQESAEGLLDRFEAHARAQGRMPVLLLNEIDGLLQTSPDLLLALRARHEASRMRFVFVGYAPVRWALDDIKGPLYHFTSAGGGAAFTLGPLDPEEGHELVGWLCREPLQLQWTDQAHQERGEELLLAASYRLPFALQDLCHSLVQALKERSAGLIELEDARRVVAARSSFLQRLESFDLAPPMGLDPTAVDSGEDARRANRARTGGRLILLLLVRRLYGARLEEQTWEDLLPTPAESRSFTTDEVLGACTEGLAELPLLVAERVVLERWLREVQMERFLSALTLSIILAPAVVQGQRGWCFQGHIYPAELARAARTGRSLEDRILLQAQALWELLKPGGGDVV